MKCVCTQNELVQQFFFVLRSNHSAPFSIDFPSQFNEIQCNSHVLRFLIRNESNNNSHSQVYLHRFDCFGLPKECINLAFLVSAVDYEPPCWLIQPATCLQALGKCRWMNTLIRVPHSHSQPSNVKSILSYCFWYFSFFSYNICCVVFVLHCVEIYQRIKST